MKLFVLFFFYLLMIDLSIHVFTQFPNDYIPHLDKEEDRFRLFSFLDKINQRCKKKKKSRK